MRHDVIDELAGVIGLQIAEFVFQHQTALHHQVRRDRVVIVRRDIPVVRHRDLDTFQRTHAECRREKTALSLLADREFKPRHHHHRNAAEVERRSRAFRCEIPLIKVEPVHIHPPGVVTLRAGRDTGFRHRDVGSVNKVHLIRAAPETSRAERVVRLRHRAGFRINAVIRLIARKYGAVLGKQHVSLRFHLVSHLRIGDAVALQGRAAAADFRIADQMKHVLRIARDLIRHRVG